MPAHGNGFGVGAVPTSLILHWLPPEPAWMFTNLVVAGLVFGEPVMLCQAPQQGG